MAKLPNHENAYIEAAKIRDYVLSSSHQVGRFKAAVFKVLGYSQDEWERLAEDIRLYHLNMDAEPAGDTRYGRKYSIVGEIKGPNGKTMLFKSLWIVLAGDDVPRFITIYPVGGDR